jgi:subtilisin-like proprotein convertase family protein
MYLGYAGSGGSFNLPDENGVSRAVREAAFDQLGSLEIYSQGLGAAQPLQGFTVDEVGEVQVYGSEAALVRSGALMAHATDAGIAAAGLEYFHVDPAGGFGTFPDGVGSMFAASDLFVAESLTVSDVDVFVSLPSTNLANLTVRAKSPAGTYINLVTPGAAIGRDLHTVFDMSAGTTLATGIAPYVDGVVPVASLNGWNGQNSKGNWRLEVSCPSGTSLGLWGWGLRINHFTVGVPRVQPRPSVAFRNAGANPARGNGVLSFDLPTAAQVDLSLFDAHGRVVQRLASGAYGAGSHMVRWSTSGIAPGIYWARLVAGHDVRALKIAVME